ncbi:MAG: HNH endonuclease [Clostridia bacterium]
MKELCDYGCGRNAVCVFKNKKKSCSIFVINCPVVKKRFLESTRKKDFSKRYELLPQETKNIMANANKGKFRITDKDIFKQYSTYCGWDIKRYIFERKKLKYVCNNCGLLEWKGKKLSLELHHKNGIINDNRLENLEFLCPNCHSITKNFRGKNIKGKRGVKKVEDSVFINALKTNKNIRQALLSLGLVPKGANYYRAKKLLEANSRPLV